MLALINLYSCREALERLNDYVDRELSAREIQLVQRHLKICQQCARKFAFEARLLEELKAKIARIDVPSDLMTRVSHSLAQAEPENGLE